MILTVWQIWIIVALALFIVEIFTPTFFAASIGIGCLFAGLGALVGLGTELQVLLFCVGGLLSFFLARPLMMKYAYNNSEDIKTNNHALIGKVGLVSSDIDQALNQGRVAIDGDDWKAVSHDGSPIAAGTRVEVLKVDSIVLTVKPVA